MNFKDGDDDEDDHKFVLRFFVSLAPGNNEIGL